MYEHLKCPFGYIKGGIQDDWKCTTENTKINFVDEQ